MMILKNIRNKIAEKLIDSELFADFEILKNNFFSQNEGKTENIIKSIMIYSLECNLDLHSRVNQEYIITGEIAIEVIFNAKTEVFTLADDLDQAVENVLGVLELAKFTESGTGLNKVLDGTCSMFTIQSVRFSQDSQAEGFTNKAVLTAQFKHVGKFTAETPTTTIEEINLDLEESSYTDSIGRITTDEDLRIL